MARENGHAASETRPRKASERLARRIAELILRESYPPGHILASEKEMIEQFSVGRTTLREALRILEVQGVVTIKAGPNGGPMVQEPSGDALADQLALMLKLRGTTFGQVLEARTVLESTLTVLAATQVTDTEVDGLYRSIERMKDNIDDPDEFFRQNRKFHLLISSATQNSVFALFVDSLNAIAEGSPVGVLSSLGRRLRVIDLHTNIADAMRERDVNAVQQAMLVHLREYEDYLRQSFPELLDQPIRWLE